MEVAIIGIAGRFPGARDIDELLYNLKNGKDSVRPITLDRIKNTALPDNRQYRPCGYLEDIDKFDHELFGISLSEAINMCPSQRLLLETAYETFENAGYNIDDFDGSNTSVYTADSGNYYYHRHADQYNATLMTGNAQEFTSARIARHFNLLGNAMAINSACSSSVVAIHLACNDLNNGDSDYVLVCSVNLDLFPFDEHHGDVKLASSDGKSRAFSSNADGMSFGETACAVLLKPLDKAIEDNDIIHAVIKGSAINNNGSNSTSILAPSSAQQAQVIKKAWLKADVTPDQLGFIEVHGSGTQIGDCLEAEGLSKAIRESGMSKETIPISTIKSNIGHCMLAAGLVGLIKAVLSLKEGSLFPNLHCEELNPNINFEKLKIRVNTRLLPWSTDADKSRYAGISSIGRSGVNSHIVIKDFIRQENSDLIETPRDYLFTISSGYARGLEENIANLLSKLEKSDAYSLQDLSFTLNKGRKHYSHRFACIANSLGDLKFKLKKCLDTMPSVQEVECIENWFIVLTDQMISKEQLNQFLDKYPEMLVGDDISVSLNNPHLRSFLFQFGIYQLLKINGVETKRFISFGVGKIVKDVILGQTTFENAIKLIEHYQPEHITDLEGKINKFVEKEGTGPIALVDFGVASDISNLFKMLYPAQIKHFNIEDQNADPYLEILKILFINNVSLNWKQIFSSQIGNRCELPAYSFKSIRCWLRDEPAPIFKSSKSNSKEIDAVTFEILEEANELEKILAHIYCEVLSVKQISIDSSFFEIGGNSLKATRLINDINKTLKVDLDFEDIYDFQTIRELANYLFEQTDTKEILRSIWKIIFKKEEITDTDNFFELGGHSLMATQIINRVKGILGTDINFEDIFNHPRLNELADFLNKEAKNSETRKNTNNNAIPYAEKREVYPVSYAQRRILILEKFYRLGTSYNMPGAFTIYGKLDKDKLMEAFNNLVRRHEIFRSSITFQETVAIQRPIENLSVPFNYIILNSEEYTPVEEKRVIEELISEHIQPFDLAKPPFLRVLLIKLEEERSVLVYDINHVAVDRHSYDLIFRDFMMLYNGKIMDRQHLTYKDYAVWQQKLFNSSHYKSKEQYWLDTFRTPYVPLNLPTDYVRSSNLDTTGRVYNFVLDKKLTDALKTTAKAQNVTIYVLLLAIFKVLLFRLTGSTDICIGSPFSERKNASLMEVVGILLNTVVFRTFPNAQKTFDKYLAEVMETTVRAHNNGEYQFEMLLDKINYKRENNRNPLFDILFNSQVTANVSAIKETEHSTGNTSQLKLEPFNLRSESSTFDLSILVDVFENTIDFNVNYRTNLFKPETIKYYMDQYIELVKQVTLNSSLYLTDYTVFERKNKEEKKRIKIVNV